jgi:hypothetical protein
VVFGFSLTIRYPSSAAGDECAIGSMMRNLSLGFGYAKNTHSSIAVF